MRGRTLMVQGTASSVGKTLLVTALCRLFAGDGHRVAPFKAQNMSNNSYVAREGGEVGRAQALQARAAGVDVSVAMNPILLKPEGDARSQVIVRGRVVASLTARDYFERRLDLWPTVAGALDELREAYDIVVIEGAGSPAEINLQDHDIVNMRVARHAAAPVLLVGDIDRGGVFAALYGTVALLPERDRALLRGLVINKFRGDVALLAPGLVTLEERCGFPVLGVVPYIRDLALPEEDSVALESRSAADAGGRIDVVVLHLDHVSNFDEFGPLAAEPGVHVRFVAQPWELGSPDLTILPGTKTTVADLVELRRRGFEPRLRALAEAGSAILGVCGGYQMMGEELRDPDHVESDQEVVSGLGLLPVTTVFATAKTTRRARVSIMAAGGPFAGCDATLAGYEIHMGESTTATAPFALIDGRGPDGSVSADGCIAGTYVHGLLENDSWRRTVIGNLASRRAGARPGRVGPREIGAEQAPESIEESLDRLAAAVRAALAMDRVYRIMDLP